MAKKKSGAKAKPLTGEAGEIIGVDQQTESAEAGLVLTAARQAPAVVARDELLRAIAGEATAIGKAKHKGRSGKALQTLARAYALVTAEKSHSAPDTPARTGSGGRGFLPSMRTVFLAKRTSLRKGNSGR
ncbi:hypothetical protein [Streptomyces sp. NPDC018045]|uniref:hypothetical protein n=1 Tax=Streptomyces sp. NPDC018045 TaxID=3365037 RepID=UPI00378CA343